MRIDAVPSTDAERVMLAKVHEPLFRGFAGTLDKAI
jgi:hypothetical protein